MLAAQAAKFALNIGSLAILARLIVPADFGLIAMVTALTGFVAMFKDAGLSMATVQRTEITPEQVSTLFWINVALSVATLLAVIALAPVVAWFYDEQRLRWVTIALAGTFILGGLTVQHQALLTRQMRFLALAAISLSSMTVGAIAAIVAALLGAGYWALVIQIAATAATNVVGVWVACDWRPGRPSRGIGVRPMLAFGGNLTGFNVINYFARNIDNILIGWYWGAVPLGFYSKAYQLLLLPIGQINSPISSVALPALSRLQEQPERFKRYYWKSIGLLAFVGMPVVAFLIVDAHDVVLFVLGDKWLPVVGIFRALGPAAFLGVLNVAAGWIYVSLGRTDRQLKWGLIAVPVIVSAIAVGLKWGAVGVAVAFSIAQCLLYPLALAFCFRGTFLRLSEFGAAIMRASLSSIAAAGVLYGLQYSALLGKAPLERIAVHLAVFAAAYIVLWLLTPGGTECLRDYLSIIRYFAADSGEPLRDSTFDEDSSPLLPSAPPETRMANGDGHLERS